PLVPPLHALERFETRQLTISEPQQPGLLGAHEESVGCRPQAGRGRTFDRRPFLPATVIALRPDRAPLDEHPRARAVARESGHLAGRERFDRLQRALAVPPEATLGPDEDPAVHASMIPPIVHPPEEARAFRRHRKGDGATHRRQGISTSNSGAYCWEPKRSLSPMLPLGRSRRIVNLIALAGSKTTK